MQLQINFQNISQFRPASINSIIILSSSNQSKPISRIHSNPQWNHWTCITKRKHEAKKRKSSYPTCNDDPCNNRNESEISEPSLPFERHKVGKHGSEERRGGPNSLVKRDRQIPQRNVPKHHRNAEHETQRRDLQELDPGSNGLHRHHLHPRNCDVAEQRTSGHVAHGEEDRVLEAIVAEQVLVQQQNPNVGWVPGRHQPDREQAALALHFNRRRIGRLRIGGTKQQTKLTER